MPKMKTHSGAKKRFKVTASGKVKYKAQGKNHINAKLSPERSARLGGAHYVGPEFEQKMKSCPADFIAPENFILSSQAHIIVKKAMNSPTHFIQYLLTLWRPKIKIFILLRLPSLLTNR